MSVVAKLWVIAKVAVSAVSQSVLKLALAESAAKARTPPTTFNTSPSAPIARADTAELLLPTNRD